nr:integrase, catalytic region, zinc finger, CCHC-type, peptidase aspartic, catalytic [Tanacetum cinerariifolium]
HEVNEIRAEKIARVANPLALVAQQQPVYHPQTNPTHYNQNSSTRTQQAATRNRGKGIVNSPQPIYDQKPSMVDDDDDETSKDKEIDKFMALISLSIHRNAGYESQRSGNVAGAKETVGSSMKPKRTKDAAYHREKMLLCKQEKAGIQLNAKQADWKDDTDDESDDQEFEAHYMYMDKIQEVSPDAVDFGPIFDTEPEQKLQNDDHYDVFAIESQHPEQSEFVHKTYLIEQYAHNVILESVDMNYDSEQIDQNDEDADLAKEKMKDKLSAHQDTISILKQQKDAQIKLYKTREDKEIEKVINLENKVKVLDNIVYKTGQSVQTINMPNNKCRTSFTKPEFLKKSKQANPRLYDIESKNANHLEPNHTWGSTATDIPSCSSLIMIDLEVVFWKSTCFIRDLEGVDLISGSRDTNLYIISLDDMLKSSLIYLLSKASKTKSWLWHRQLSHLNFACALGKSKKSSHQPKAEDTNQEKLYLLHMDLCGLMRVASINEKRYILVIVDDYLRFTLDLKAQLQHKGIVIRTVKFGNDQITPILGYGDLVQGAITIKRVYYVEGMNHNLFSVGQFCDADLEVAFRKSTCFIRDLKGNDLLTGKAKRKSFHTKLTPSSTRRLHLLHMDLCGPMRVTLHAYFAAEGIQHQTSVARTPKQNGIVERRNRTLIEAARTMLSAANVPLFFWAEAIATACFTQNRSLVIPRHEKTHYHIINDQKPSVKFFHIFGSVCYIVRDGENLDKMKEKGDECIFVGYSNQSRAYRDFNKRTRVIMESIHVNFNELPHMASVHISSDPVPECQTTALNHDSLSPTIQH